MYVYPRYRYGTGTWPGMVHIRELFNLVPIPGGTLELSTEVSGDGTSTPGNK